MTIRNAVPVFGNVPRSALAYRKRKKQPRLDMFLQAACMYVKGRCSGEW